MNTFEYSTKLCTLLMTDDKIIELLGIDGSDASFVTKLRQQDVMSEEITSEALPFVAFYFADAEKTRNDYMNKAILRIDIYAHEYADVAKIRARIVELVHSEFDERIRAEGQYSSGIPSIYKYRLEFTPLVFT